MSVYCPVLTGGSPGREKESSPKGGKGVTGASYVGSKIYRRVKISPVLGVLRVWAILRFILLITGYQGEGNNLALLLDPVLVELLDKGDTLKGYHKVLSLSELVAKLVLRGVDNKVAPLAKDEPLNGDEVGMGHVEFPSAEYPIFFLPAEVNAIE